MTHQNGNVTANRICFEHVTENQCRFAKAAVYQHFLLQYIVIYCCVAKAFLDGDVISLQSYGSSADTQLVSAEQYKPSLSA